VGFTGRFPGGGGGGFNRKLTEDHGGGHSLLKGWKDEWGKETTMKNSNAIHGVRDALKEGRKRY